MNKAFTLFTDGSSRGNPGPGGWAYIVVKPTGEVVEGGGGEEKTTNNRMEMTGIIEALQSIKGATEPITIYTDSSYVVNGVTKWVKGWQKNNWLTSTKEGVLNRDLWERLVEVVDSFSQKISWQIIAGHSGIAGNERVDEIATAYADKDIVSLYNGELADYPVDVFNLSEDIEKKETKSNKKDRRQAYSYVSLVDGVITVDKSWVECEKRVRGKKAARFKKVFSETEQQALIAEWQK